MIFGGGGLVLLGFGDLHGPFRVIVGSQGLSDVISLFLVTFCTDVFLTPGVESVIRGLFVF